MDEAADKKCPKCGGVMEWGKSYAVGGNVTSPVLTFFSGIYKLVWGRRISRGGWTDAKTFACTQCGYLESYLEHKE